MRFKGFFFLMAIFAIVSLFLISCSADNTPTGPAAADQVSIVAKNTGDNGFDQFGYNYNTGIFVGKADGVDRILDGKVWGDPTYANDKLVMKYSRAWVEARFNGGEWTPQAWCSNEWNGSFPSGSGEVWHYKIIWVGMGLENSPYWRPGGYPIWGQFEVILSQGKTPEGHFWETHANPAGYGAGTN
ncbi:MAG: hypothetical protein UV40_C0021G0042 [Parcubacteria group bacterium GW2011_GWA1_42_7]|nr:MAG: hypothetical protein UV34_C0019G0015 [Parcubacteria group bacterium GW2011_GWB1_42_6]KKS69541.1 MAG: hypothetical protein UV40_C0021G0042 [Parcubacteria group bacterium GW2011_GWA1_42_7]KKS91467.1 MAG: hypothetical protein UV67_C0027G0028 [Parcubacteria group bacterium GW2011_GWC1_43_12]